MAIMSMARAGLVAALATLTLLAGCDEQRIKELEEGLSTEVDVRDRFFHEEELLGPRHHIQHLLIVPLEDLLPQRPERLVQHLRFDLIWSQTSTEHSTDDGSHTGSSYHVDGNPFSLEDTQHSDVRETSCSAAT